MLNVFSAVVLSLHRGSREVPMASFQEWAFDLLRTALEFDSALWLTGVVNSDGKSATFHTRHLYRQPLQLLDDYNRCKNPTDFTHRVFGSPGTTFACTPSIDLNPELAAHARRYCVEQILATGQVELVAGINELISLYRHDVARPFAEHERVFQQCLVPHLSEAWRVCRMKHLAHLSQPVCALNTHTAGADIQGVLHLIDPGFTRLLRTEWPGWRGPLLPAELFAAYQHGDLRHVGQRVAFRLSGVHDHILLRGRLKVPLDDLSRREREVADHYAAGKSSKEIARILGLAPPTVRNHLTAAYAKLGIDNKAALATVIRKNE